MLLDPVAMAETDEDAPDSWALGFGEYECRYRNVKNYDFDCLMIYAWPMEYVAHMQQHHPDVDLDPSVDVDLDPSRDVDLDSSTSVDVDLDPRSLNG